MVLNESSSLDWSAIECDALGSTFPRMKFHEISLKITSKFIRFFYNGWSTTVIHSPKRMNKQLFFFIERKDFRDRRRTNLFELRVYVRLLKRSPLSGIVVTEKAATRMKFDAVSSKAVGTISDYQQPRQNRVFGKSSFVIRTVSADYECLAQALRYAHPLPLLLTRRKRVLSFLDDSLPQFPTILLRARASLHEFRIHCPNILPWKSSTLLDIASQTFVFVQRAVGHRSNAVNFKIGGGKMEEIGKGIETGFGFQSYALCLVLRVFEARGEGDWSSSTCPTLLGRFMEGKLASSSHFQVVSGHVDGLD